GAFDNKLKKKNGSYRYLTGRLDAYEYGIFAGERGSLADREFLVRSRAGVSGFWGPGGQDSRFRP
ncbi:MAG TPA: hypothetical protein PKM59_11480, partial [Thermodesulfobacteriota bacterium]|nr:hypothetical protein [Thermodesulfobacteriota bacterium]